MIQTLFLYTQHAPESLYEKWKTKVRKQCLHTPESVASTLLLSRVCRFEYQIIACAGHRRGVLRSMDINRAFNGAVQPLFTNTFEVRATQLIHVTHYNFLQHRAPSRAPQGGVGELDTRKESRFRDWELFFHAGRPRSRRHSPESRQEYE